MTVCKIIKSKSYLLLYCIFVLAFSSCYKHETYPEVQIYGHAGMGMDIGMSIYHDNSFEAMALALALPTIDGVEMDVRMSAEGTLWLYHENKLEAHTDGEGCIFEATDAELETIRYKSLHKEKLAKLDQIWPLLGERHIILDLKHWNACTEGYVDMQRFKEALYAIPEKYRKQITLDSSYPYWLNELSQDFQVVFSTVSFEEGLEQLNKVPSLKGLMLRSKDITAEQISALKSMGKDCYLFEMRSSKKQRAALKKQPFAILADDPRGALVIRD
ncbi:MAG: glycerophosphodiester phosphodiesterase [Flavobacteriales bacterium]